MYKEAAVNGNSVSTNVAREKTFPVSFSGTALDNIARIIGRDKLPNTPTPIDRYICQDCHVKACTKAAQRDDVTDIMAIVASANPRYNSNIFINYALNE